MTEPTSNMKLEGRVATILNARELVINIGCDMGVEEGQVFAVLADKPVEVRDPRTQEVLDSIDREKTRVKATEVRERITICRTYRGVGGFGPVNLAEAMRRFSGQFEPETLRATDNDKLPPLSEAESYVKINDRVVAVDDK